MSGLVPTKPGTPGSVAIQQAIKNALVGAQINSADAPAYNTLTSQGYTPGQFVDIGKNTPVNLETAGDLVVVAGGNTLTIDPNLRTDGVIPSGLTPAQERAFIQAHPIVLDNYATIVVGGGSSLTFANDTIDSSFGTHVIAGIGANTIHFNSGPDLFQGTAGTDTIFAGKGLDTIDASHTTSGSESIVGGGGNLLVDLGTGGKASDTVDLSKDAVGQDTIFGNSSHPVTLKVSEKSSAYHASEDSSTGITTITFKGSAQVLEVKHVTIDFAGGGTAKF